MYRAPSPVALSDEDDEDDEEGRELDRLDAKLTGEDKEPSRPSRPSQASHPKKPDSQPKSSSGSTGEADKAKPAGDAEEGDAVAGEDDGSNSKRKRQPSEVRQCLGHCGRDNSVRGWSGGMWMCEEALAAPGAGPLRVFAEV